MQGSELERLLKTNLDEVLKVITSRVTLGLPAVKLENSMKARIRAGRGVAGNGEQEQLLKSLSREYIKKRSKMALDETTSPSTSNLTLTGQMIASITAQVMNGKISIGVTGASNQNKALWAESKGRPFIYISAVESEALILDIEEAISKALRRKFGSAAAIRSAS